MPEPVRAALFRALLELELAYRRQIGERPTPEEYRGRFPEHVAVIETILGAEPPVGPPGPGPARTTNLLFGLLALQNNFIDRDTLVAAFAAWVTDKSRELGWVLLESGAIDAETHALLEALAGKHLQRHGGDLGDSLAALSSLGSAREDLEQVADSELQTYLTRAARTDEHGSRRPRPACPRGRHRHRRGHAVPHPAAAPDRRPGGRLRRPRRGAAPRGGAEGDPRPTCRRPGSRSRFVLEAEITGRLEHPGIIPVYGLGTYADGRPFYAMRFIKGDNLKDAIAHFHEADVPGRDPGERALAVRELLRRFVDVCNAMAYAHSRGIIHRDLKPNNILLGPYGETLVVDWGLAKPVDRPDEASHTEEETLRPDFGRFG